MLGVCPSAELTLNAISDTEGIGINGPGIGHTAAGRHEAAVGHIQVLYLMGAAVCIQHRCVRIVTKPAATRDQVGRR